MTIGESGNSWFESGNSWFEDGNSWFKFTFREITNGVKNNVEEVVLNPDGSNVKEFIKSRLSLTWKDSWTLSELKDLAITAAIELNRFPIVKGSSVVIKGNDKCCIVSSINEDGTFNCDIETWTIKKENIVDSKWFTECVQLFINWAQTFGTIDNTPNEEQLKDKNNIKTCILNPDRKNIDLLLEFSEQNPAEFLRIIKKSVDPAWLFFKIDDVIWWAVCSNIWKKEWKKVLKMLEENLYKLFFSHSWLTVVIAMYFPKETINYLTNIIINTKIQWKNNSDREIRKVQVIGIIIKKNALDFYDEIIKIWGQEGFKVFFDNNPHMAKELLKAIDWSENEKPNDFEECVKFTEEKPRYYDEPEDLDIPNWEISLKIAWNTVYGDSGKALSIINQMNLTSKDKENLIAKFSGEVVIDKESRIISIWKEEYDLEKWAFKEVSNLNNMMKYILIIRESKNLSEDQKRRFEESLYEKNEKNDGLSIRIPIKGIKYIEKKHYNLFFENDGGIMLLLEGYKQNEQIPTLLYEDLFKKWLISEKMFFYILSIKNFKKSSKWYSEDINYFSGYSPEGYVLNMETGETNSKEELVRLILYIFYIKRDYDELGKIFEILKDTMDIKTRS